MPYKLEKTFLSNALKPNALYVAILSFLSLLLIYSLDLDHLKANGILVFEKQEYWRLFTSALLHADLNHLAHNAFFFTGLSLILYGYFGSWVFPTISLLAGGLINFITLWFYPPEVSLVGISGVVYFMASFWLMSFILIERRQAILKRLIYAIGMALIFLFPETFQTQTSYLAHGVGFLVGIPVAICYYLLNLQKIRSGEKWIYKPETVINFDWGEIKTSDHNEETGIEASRYTHRALHNHDQ